METLDEKQFEAAVLKAETPVLVQFWAAWCTPCRIMEPVVDDIQKEYSEQLKVYRVNIDAAAALVARYNVVSVPTIILFIDGEPAVRIVGFTSKRDVCKQVESRLDIRRGA